MHSLQFIAAAAAALTSFLLMSFGQRAIALEDRFFSVSVNETQNITYDASFDSVKSLGINFVSLSLPWDEVEISKGNYRNKFPQIANLFFSKNKTKVALILTPIDTNSIRIPKDLKARRLDDPEVISRFNKALDWVMGQMNDVEIVCLSIGNEVDCYLGKNAGLWQQYKSFFEATRKHARQVKPGLVVGSKITFSALRDDPEAKKLATLGDAVMATYYPLNDDFSVKDPVVASTDMELLANRFPTVPIYMLEVGYPSSNLLGSSQQKQADFLKRVFHAWHRLSNKIKLVELTWLNDISEREQKSLGTYYRCSDSRFLAYLGSIGLRDERGIAKSAWNALVEQTAKYGFHR